MKRCPACQTRWTGGRASDATMCPGCGYNYTTGFMPTVRPDGSPNPPAPANVATSGWLAIGPDGTAQPGWRMAYFDPEGPEGGTFHYTGRAFVPGQNGA
jgi:hypothetical protein